MTEFDVDTSRDTGYMAKNTISATRTSANIMDIPSTIQIADRELIADLNTDSMLQAAEFVAAGIDRRSFNPGDDQFIWGFRSSSTLKDGFPFASNAVGSLYDVDRVEVIKGPAAMIFGQAAFVGGIINYVSRQPTKVFHADLEVTFGSYDYRKIAAHLSGPITKKLLARIDTGTTQSNYSERKFGYYRDGFVGVGITYQISDQAKLEIDGSIGYENYLYPQTFISPITGQLFPSRTFTLDDVWATYPTQQARITGTLNATLGGGIQSRTFLGYNNSNNAWLRPYALQLEPDGVTLDRLSENYYTSGHTVDFQQDFVKQLDIGPIDQKFTGGAEVRWDTSDYENSSFATSSLNIYNPVYGAPLSNVPGSGPGGYIGNNYSWDTITGVYLQDEIGLFHDRINFVGGGRFNGFESVSGSPPPNGTFLPARNDNKTISRYGILVHPIDHTTLYASHSESFIFNSGTTYPEGRPLVPSVGNDNEFGAKAAFFDGAVFLEATYFRLKLTNVRIAFTSGGFSSIEQTGAQTNNGEDLSAGVSKKFRDVQLDGIATYYHGDIRDQYGNTPAYIANNTWSLFGTAHYKLSADSAIGVGGGVHFQGERVGPVFGGGIATPDRWPAYTIGDALAFFQWGRYRLQLNVNNVTDKIYIEGGEGALWIYTNPGRIVKASLSYRF